MGQQVPGTGLYHPAAHYLESTPEGLCGSSAENEIRWEQPDMLLCFRARIAAEVKWKLFLSIISGGFPTLCTQNINDRHLSYLYNTACWACQRRTMSLAVPPAQSVQAEAGIKISAPSG